MLMEWIDQRECGYLYLDEGDQFDHGLSEDGSMMEGSDNQIENFISEEKQEREVLGDGGGDEDDEWEGT